MNYYYSPASLYKIIPKEGEPYFHTVWAYKDTDKKDFHKDHMGDDMIYMGETELTIVQPWYEAFFIIWCRFTCWLRGKWWKF